VIACLLELGDLPAVILLGFLLFELGRVALDDHRERRAIRDLDRDPFPIRPMLRLVRPGRYDWREEGRTDPKGSPPGRASP
jgi:hypothetical protein